MVKSDHTEAQEQILQAEHRQRGTAKNVFVMEDGWSVRARMITRWTRASACV